MMKKLTSLLITLVMVMQCGAAVFADEIQKTEYNEIVKTSGILQVVQSGKTIDENTKNTATVVKNTSDATYPEFDFLCTLNMQTVREAFADFYELGQLKIDGAYSDYKSGDLATRLAEMEIGGNFKIEITYPKGLAVPTEFLTTNDVMYGFDDNAKLIFGNDKRTLTEGETENTLTIELEIVGLETEGRPGCIAVKDLYGEDGANIEKYLCDLTLKCSNVATSDYGSYKVKGKMTGNTFAEGRSTKINIDYITEPETVEATCVVSRPSNGGGLGGGTSYTITFDVDGDTSLVDSVKKSQNTTIKVNDLKHPYKDGYAFDGWYTDSELTDKVTEDFKLTKNMTLYGTWEKSKSAGRLNDTDHYAYVVGYPDGNVNPENYITREEIATIFFRLLWDSERTNILRKSNSFSDVDRNRWSNTAISTMENGGFIHGYTDGTFAPSENITRAEFATIASALDDMTENLTHGFSDISGHWAEDYIADAVSKGWLAGYEDGTFRPEQNITRAEAMTIINRMLNRFVNEAGLHKDAVLWPDNDKGKWYYYAVEEATNSHDYTRQSDGIYETWTAITENKDWSSLEN